MCGICGIIDRSGKPISRALLEPICEAIAHRGPDDSGIVTRPGAALGSRRLAVLDLTQQAHMPMTDPDVPVWLVFNGEIYNFETLRTELQQRGHRFRSTGDSEVVLRSYLEWGDACCERLEGMFAFAIWDERSRRLLAARDRLGVKPLFYLEQGDRLAFASEVHALYGLLPPTAEAIDPISLDFYLGFGYLPPDCCLLSGIEKLPPGHRLIVDASGTRVERWWQLSFTPDPSLDEANALEEWDEIFRAAVARRLKSDVPLGCFLSGGIDSGLVTAVAAELGSGPVHTFSVGFGGTPAEDDERPLARLVAERYGTRHTELQVDPADRSLLPQILHNIGEPFADVGCLPMAQISRAARDHITVSLSGDGGDESFAGYANVLAARTAERFRTQVPSALRSLLAFGSGLASALPTAARASRWLDGYVNAPLVSHFGFFDHWRPQARADLYDPAWRERIQPDACDALVKRFMPPTELAHDLGDADQHLFTDLQLRLAGDYLTKVDIASSAVSLEVRSPFLDPRVVEWASRLPLELKLRGGRSKGFLRRYAERLLPAELISAPKRGFAPDIGRWLRGEWAPFTRALLEDSRAAEAGILRGSVIQATAKQHWSGRAEHGQRLWNLVCLEIWWRLFITRESVIEL